MTTEKLLTCIYDIQIYAIEQFQKQRDHYETFLLNRKLHKIEHQLREMLEQELHEDTQSFDDSHLQMVKSYMSKHSTCNSSSTNPPEVDLPIFRRERKSEARLEKLKKKKRALKKQREQQMREQLQQQQQESETIVEESADVESDAVTIVSTKNYFDKHTLNFVNTYGDSGGYSRIRQALGIQSKRECNLWGI